MDKTVIGLLSGASALVLVSGAQASAAVSSGAEAGLQPARSFAELLEPIPNAADQLQAQDQRADDGDQKPFEVAQYYHHHHHHYHHHHHHHHHYHHHHHHYY